ncbi:MAG: hypothetical protein ACRC0J_11360 [Shewanella oncorhynchi]
MSKKLSTIGITNQKERAFTKAPIAQDIVWKQGQLSGGVELSHQFARTVTSQKQIDINLNAGAQESICPWTIQAHYKVNTTVGVADIEDWVIYPEATAGAPANLPAGKVAIKPIAGGHAAGGGVTNGGCLIPKMLFAAQFHKITPQQPNDKVWNTALYSNARTIGNVLEHEIVTEYVNGPGVVDRSNRCRNDWTAVVPDENFRFLPDRRRVEGGSAAALELTEKLPTHVTYRRNGAFSVGDPQSDSFRQLPPGCCIKLSCQTRPSATERLKIGQAQVWDAGAGAWSAAQDVFIKFYECELFYLCTTEWPQNWTLARTIPILGDKTTAHARAGALVDASVGTSTEGYEQPLALKGSHVNSARYTFCDPVQRQFPLTAGETAKLIKVNENTNDVMPGLTLLYIGRNSDWTMEQLASRNKTLMNWGVDDCTLKKVTPSIGSGPQDKCPFMDMYPGNDINDDSLLEKQIMDDMSGGTLLCPFYRWDDTCLTKQSTYAYNSWQQRKADVVPVIEKLPFEKSVMFMSDLSGVVVKDASNGSDASTLQFLVEFDAAVPAADYVLYVWMFYRHNFVLSLKNSNPTEVPQYSVNTTLTNLAFGAK